MSPQQILALIVRLFSILLAAYAFQTAFLSLSEPMGIYSKVAIAFFGGSLTISVLMWKFPKLIAGKLLGSDFEHNVDKEWSSQELYSIGFIVVGLLWLILALSDIIYWIAFSLYISEYGSYDNQIPLDADQKALIVSTVFELIISFTLIFGSKGWLRLVNRLRFGK